MSQLVQNKQWKHTAIQRSETITDVWDVIKVYLGRGAVVILFICMIGDVIQVLPGGLLQQWVISSILGVQIVTIDVAGFGLQSIAENARLNGDEKGYKKAMLTSYALISIMMITLFLLTTAQIWPVTKPFVSTLNDALILVRVGMTVLYGHIVHSLGKSQHHLIPAHVADDLQHQLERMQHDHEATIRRLETETRDKVTFLETQQQQKLDLAIQEITSRLEANNMRIQSSDFTTDVAHVTPSVDNLVEKSNNLVEISPSMSTTLSTVEVRPEETKATTSGVEPMTSLVDTLSTEEINLVIEAYKSGVVKSKMCAHLHWSTSKYKAIGAVIEQYNKVVNKV